MDKICDKTVEVDRGISTLSSLIRFNILMKRTATSLVTTESAPPLQVKVIASMWCFVVTTPSVLQEPSLSDLLADDEEDDEAFDKSIVDGRSTEDPAAALLKKRAKFCTFEELSERLGPLLGDQEGASHASPASRAKVVRAILATSVFLYFEEKGATAIPPLLSEFLSKHLHSEIPLMNSRRFYQVLLALERIGCLSGMRGLSSGAIINRATSDPDFLVILDLCNDAEHELAVRALNSLGFPIRSRQPEVVPAGEEDTCVMNKLCFLLTTDTSRSSMIFR